MTSILFISKRRQDTYRDKALEFLQQAFPDTTVVLGLPGEKAPEVFDSWQGDYIISYLCPWVLRPPLLSRARVAAINFHPAPPEYPGTGCTNFALYNQETSYGVVCHHMAPRVDSGQMVAVRRFPILESDTVYSLTQRCYGYMLELFYEIVSLIIEGKPLPVSDEMWTRDPYRLKDLNALKVITPDMPPVEIQRRIRAVTYPGYLGAHLVLHGMVFEYRGKESEV
jgi:methionyl-tRNA formyltransferase